MKRGFIILGLLVIISLFVNMTLISSQSNYDVSLRIAGMSIVIVSPLNITYTVSTIDFNVTSNENISFCFFSIDSWANNISMERVNNQSFGYISSMGNGQYTARFWCNNSDNNINDQEQVTFVVNVGGIPDDDADDSGDDSGGGGGGGGGGYPPKGNVSDQNRSAENQTLPIGLVCQPGSCNLTSHKYCNDAGQWIETTKYCEICSGDEVCQKTPKELLLEYCGNRRCDKSLGESIFTCFNDCKYELIKNAIALIITIVILITVIIARRKIKQKTKTEYVIKGREDTPKKQEKQKTEKKEEEFEKPKPIRESVDVEAKTDVKKTVKMPSLKPAKQEKYKELLSSMPAAKVDDKYIKMARPYVEEAIAAGMTKSEIRKQLIDKKWPKKVVDDVLKEF
ncbi:MAG: hypothetical protein ABIE22_02300 [archaeon]